MGIKLRDLILFWSWVEVHKSAVTALHYAKLPWSIDHPIYSNKKGGVVC